MESDTPRARIEREAIRWLQKRESEPWTATDEAELNRWLRASPGHSVSYIRLRSVWRRLGQLENQAQNVPQKKVPPQLEHPRRVPPPRSVSKPVALAATVLLSLALGILAYLHTGSVYTTAIGRITVVDLGDRSTITLNTNTRIKLWSSRKKLRVELDYGEAFFDITPDSRRPLSVSAANQRVVVLGTKFSMWSKPDLLHVVVLSGKIRVEPLRPVAPGTPATPTAPHHLVATLGGGEVADVRNGDVTVRQEPVKNIERSLAWQTGDIRLDGDPLAEAVDAFNRYNTRQIVFGDPSLRQVKIGGSFRWDNLDGFLGLLDHMGVHSEVRDGQIVLTSKHGAI